MPDKVMEQAITTLDDAIEHIDVLVAEVAAQRTSKRRFMIVVALLFAILFTSGGVLVYVVQRLEQDRVSSCRASNDRFAHLFDFIDLQVGVDNPEGQAFVNGMRASAVIDCDLDGELDDDLTAP